MKRSLPTVLLLTLLTAGCASTPDVGCITPPPVLTASQRTTALEIAADLEAIPKGNLAFDFQDAILLNFDRLSDPNACLYLYLKAIECYLDQGKVGRDLAAELAGYVRVAWARRCGFRNAPLELTPAEWEHIADSRYGPYIQGPLSTIGFER
ncbi:MAG: hypothetical protein AAFZ65_16675 [Planctomycetota bacterium]